MPGQLADFFRLWWSLFYWNTRKSWFQLRRGRSACPCQNPSDSGRAYQTQCDACLGWSKPARFQRVCPLLVATPEGLRCSVDTRNVRPFWLRALRFYGGAALALYVGGVVAVFGFLRTVGYPVSILHVSFPPWWHRVGQARGGYFLAQSQQAFAAGRATEGLLYLANAYDFDPGNYQVGITLAKTLQATQPARADHVFERLMRDHPGHRAATAQDWFRALLARGSFDRVATLARDEVRAGSPHGGVWVRALLFATRQTGSDAVLHELLATDTAGVRPWHPVFETELLVRAGRSAEARAAIEGPWQPGAPPFVLFHRVSALIELREPVAALDLLEKHADVFDPEAAATLRLDAYAAARSRGLQRQLDALLAGTLNAPTVKLLCAHLIRHPDAAAFRQLWDKFSRQPLPLDSDHAGAWFSLLCAAGAVGDRGRLHELTTRLTHASTTPFAALSVVEAFFRGETPGREVVAILPVLPLPLEVTYALLERYSGAKARGAISAKRT